MITLNKSISFSAKYFSEVFNKTEIGCIQSVTALPVHMWKHYKEDEL